MAKPLSVRRSVTISDQCWRIGWTRRLRLATTRDSHTQFLAANPP